MKNLILFFAFISLIGCKSAENLPVKPEQLHGEYIVYEILGFQLGNLIEAAPTFILNVRETLFQGSAGCNSIFGEYVLNGKNLEFPALAATEKYCAEGNVMKLERDFIEALNQTEQFEYQKGILTFYGKGKKTILRATKKPQQ